VFAGLQIADAHSTYSAGQRGIGESNPLMMGVAGSPAGLATAKVAATATTIAATELLWRRNRKAAVITTIALNVAYAAIVAHNYRATRAHVDVLQHDVAAFALSRTLGAQTGHQWSRTSVLLDTSVSA
jgi:hypothetical protein